jgi:hypothetical protein
MPYIISDSRRGGRVVSVAFALAFAFAAFVASPAHAAGNIANPYACTPQPTLSPVFATWSDFGLYTPVKNAGLEEGATGWMLSGGAAVISGNEPWQIGGALHAKSLDLPAGSSAITAPICIDQTYPYFRLFAKSAGTTKSSLKIDVLFFDIKGKLINTKPYDYTATSTAWQPTGTVKINVFTPKTTVAAAPVAFRFAPASSTAHYQIDDVYVDPWARG